jgi:small subunit ribosomal protein S16
MVKIRLQRLGKKNAPFYRVVAIDESKKRSGEALDVIGFWYPEKNDKQIDKKKIEAWVKKGAVVTKGVKQLI